MITSTKILAIKEYDEVFGKIFPYAVLSLEIGDYLFLDRSYMEGVIGDSKIGDFIVVDVTATGIKQTRSN